MSMASQAFNVQVQFNDANKDCWCEIRYKEKTGMFKVRVYVGDKHVGEQAVSTWVKDKDHLRYLTDKEFLDILNEFSDMLRDIL